MATGQPVITSFLRSREGRVFLDGQPRFETPAANFLAEWYRYEQMAYPKFFKMDGMCKAAVLGSEVLFKARGGIAPYAPERAGIVLSNRSSSLGSDLEHLESISDPDNFFPSPAVFVYTLPNISVGEICIRQGIKGENSFFLFPGFNAQFMEDYISGLFLEDKTDICMGGWIELSGNTPDLFLFIAERAEKGRPFDADELNKIFAL